ncbi:MAG: phospho-sugar mutase [Muribaculaceae bacterium]|nr:phospho-sugar mutase [Muribaculaceae bacterium]
MENNEQLIEQVRAKAAEWIGEGYDEFTRNDVKRMLDAEDPTELIESFYKDLEFGTGGLRGIMGSGTNRMNRYTVGAATQGLANYLNEAFAELPEIKVAVGYDVRNNSREFAEIVADVFSANGITVYLFDGFRPTPELSFAIRELGCQSGVNITASHNPKEYNGYKAYWSDGAQIIAPHDVNIVSRVASITPGDIKFGGDKSRIHMIGEEIDRKFLDAIKGLQLSPEIVKKHSDLKIVYTPIHGTGVKLIPESLQNYGFTNIIHVPEQDVPSGDFPTVDSPNPENPSAMAMAIAKAKETNADIVMASDPDADRIGCVMRNNQGEYVLINGNQIVMILLNYIITRNKELGLLKGNEYIVKTIVTTEVIKSIAERAGIKMFDCYTGFKWIAAVIRDNEETMRYLGGGEESYGFLAETFCRDKDSVSAICLMAEACAWAKEKGMDFGQMLAEIYMNNGFSREEGISVVRPGKTGADEIQQMMKNFRANPPETLGGSRVEVVKDYADLTLKTIADGKVAKMDMPATSNVLQFFTADGSKVSIRPSGTEPKIKFYIEAQHPMGALSDYDEAEAAAKNKIAAIKADLGI